MISRVDFIALMIFHLSMMSHMYNYSSIVSKNIIKTNCWKSNMITGGSLIIVNPHPFVTEKGCSYNLEDPGKSIKSMACRTPNHRFHPRLSSKFLLFIRALVENGACISSTGNGGTFGGSHLASIWSYFTVTCFFLKKTRWSIISNVISTKRISNSLIWLRLISAFLFLCGGGGDSLTKPSLWQKWCDITLVDTNEKGSLLKACNCCLGGI